MNAKNIVAVVTSFVSIYSVSVEAQIIVNKIVVSSDNKGAIVGAYVYEKGVEISLDSNSGIKSVTTQFLDGCDWLGMSHSRQDNCRSWTNLFTAREVEFPESVIGNFSAFVDHMSCSGETYVSLGGSNGCADQLTNWDGTQKQDLGAPKKKDKGMSM